MKLVLSEEETAVRESFRDLFGKECPTDLVRTFQETPELEVIDGLWRALSRTGFFGFAIPESYGGEGARLFELGLAVMEAGRALCPTPVYSTVGFGYAVTELGDDAHRRAWLPRVAAGDIVATVALSDPSDAGDVRPRLAATRVGDGWDVTGSLEFVANGDLAQELLVPAVTGGDGEPTRILCFVIPTHDLTVERMATMARDSQTIVTLDAVRVGDPVRVIGGDAPGGVPESELARISNGLTALQTMEMAGGAQAILDRTVDYLKTREQFGRPLAGFQAVQHHVATMHIAIEGARLAAYQAAWWAARGRDVEREVSIAKLKCNEAYRTSSLTAHQLHGGMGYMREFDLHLWSERAKSTELLGGSSAVALRRIEHTMGLVG